MKSTFETRLKLSGEKSALLDKVAEYLSFVERALYRDICRGTKAKDLKNSYLKKYGLTARWFNALRVSLEGKIDSIKALKELQKKDLRLKIAALEKKCQKGYSTSFVTHQKKRRLTLLKHRLEKLETLSLCFGTKKKFREQFHLEGKSFSAWKEEWREARNNEFFCLGSKDETGGNQTFTLSKEGRLRLPPFFEKKYGKYLYLKEVEFRYGQKQIDQALSHKQAISYRFKRDAKSWKLFATTELEKLKIQTSKSRGSIGVDINENHLAVTEIDSYGNPINHKRYGTCFYGKTKQQARAQIGEVAKNIVSYARNAKKPLVLEKLDFSKKKAELRQKISKHSRMLSSFAYSKLIEMIKAKAFKEGVEVLDVNPAYSSVIGRNKFSKRYGLTTHQAAALVIARRTYSFSENPNQIKDHGTLLQPVRNASEHVWSFWSKVLKKERAASAMFYRAKRSLEDSPRLSVGEGEIPSRESAGRAVRPACYSYS